MKALRFLFLGSALILSAGQINAASKNPVNNDFAQYVQTSAANIKISPQDTSIVKSKVANFFENTSTIAAILPSLVAIIAAAYTLYKSLTTKAISNLDANDFASQALQGVSPTIDSVTKGALDTIARTGNINSQALDNYFSGLQNLVQGSAVSNDEIIEYINDFFQFTIVQTARQYKLPPGVSSLEDFLVRNNIITPSQVQALIDNAKANGNNVLSVTSGKASGGGASTSGKASRGGASDQDQDYVSLSSSFQQEAPDLFMMYKEQGDIANVTSDMIRQLIITNGITREKFQVEAQALEDDIYELQSENADPALIAKLKNQAYENDAIIDDSSTEWGA